MMKQQEKRKRLKGGLTHILQFMVGSSSSMFNKTTAFMLSSRDYTKASNGYFKSEMGQAVNPIPNHNKSQDTIRYQPLSYLKNGKHPTVLIHLCLSKQQKVCRKHNCA